MRIKTLLLTAALTAIGSAAVMAQTNVYSLNAVGYVNVSLVKGFNMIADQLQSTNNTISNLLNDAAGTYDGLTVYKWTGSGFQTDTANSAIYPNNWQNSGVITLNPGEAAWIKTPAAMTITFVGTVPTGNLTVNLAGAGAFSMVSSMVPQAGDLATNLGYTNFNDGDKIFVFNPATQAYQTFNVSFAAGNTGYNQDFVNTGDPVLAVGQGFWYQTAKTAPATVWTRSFSIGN